MYQGNRVDGKLPEPPVTEDATRLAAGLSGGS